jgi:ParB/RepB/Spo0J family partition protein
MTLETLPLSVIFPSKDNPRSASNAERIEGLAASIKVDGLLQNLVVTPLTGRGSKGKYGLISGHRRYHALCWLRQQGVLAEDYEALVTIRTHLCEAAKLRIATVENVQRENLEPLDEAHAYATLLRSGTPLEDLSAETGVSIPTMKRRLVAYLRPADNCDRPLASRLKGRHQPVIRTRNGF